MPAVAPRSVRWLCLAAMVGTAAYLAWIGGRAIRAPTPDFEYFYKAGSHLLARGALDHGIEHLPDGTIQRRGTIEWYLPFVSRVMTLIAWLPFHAAGFVWVALNTLAFLLIVALLGRHLMGLPPQDWPVTLLVPVLIVVFFWHWEFRLNQIDTLTLLLLVAGYAHWQQQRLKLAGFELGLAVLLKVTPVLLIIWFALKRQFRTVGVALLTVVLAGPVADMIAFRPAYAWDAYRRWFETTVAGSSHRGLILSQREMDWRNQGLGAVACRWLHPTNYALHFDNDPRIKINETPATMNLLALPPTRVAAIVMALTGLSVAGLLWLARRPAQQLSLWQLRTEWALFVLAMLWLMPVLRRYHLILMLPALSVLASGIHYARPQRWWSRLAFACVGGVVVCQLAVVTRELPDWQLLPWLDGLLGPRTVQALSRALDAGVLEASGVLLLSIVLLAIPMITLLVWLKRRPDALPAHTYAPPHPARAALPTAGDSAIRVGALAGQT